MSHRSKFSSSLKLRPRLLLSLVVAVLVWLLLPQWMRLSARILCGWDAGILCFLSLTWLFTVRATPDSMRRYARIEDEGRLAILSIIVTAASASILAIGFLLREQKGLPITVLSLHLLLAIATIVGSWLLVHTIFALQYAHIYYQDGRTLPECKAEGLDFPNDIEPDYWDFLYFSFVIGMTSQVSDVQITSRQMRQFALMHGILSFFFNTTILAISINIIAGII